MGTPKNKKDIKTPLSTIKKGPIKGLRNILAHPQEFVWPILNKDKQEDLNNLLEQLLPNQKSIPRPVSWAQLRKMPKEEREKLKKEIQMKKLENEPNKIMNEITLGVNAVTRALEKDNLATILLDSNVEPLIMIKHVVTMGQNKKIPVLLVPFLKSSTLNRLGFASAALGIKKSSVKDENSHFSKLHERILSISETLPKPKNPTELFSDNDEEDSENEEIPKDDLKKPSEPFKLSTSVYLYRTSVKSRVFIPPNTKELSDGQQNKSSSDFISLGEDVDMTEFNKNVEEIKKKGRYVNIYEPKEKKCKKSSQLKEVSNNENETKSTDKSKIHYRPLKVKRIQGNPQRLKATKMAKSKKKSTSKK